jgi:hypothetical protein
MGRFDDRSAPAGTATTPQAGRFASRSTIAQSDDPQAQLETMFGATAAPPERGRGISKPEAIANNILSSVPLMNYLQEFANASNRSIAETIDFLGPDQINFLLRQAGSQKQMPTAKGAMQYMGAGLEGAQYTEPGLAQDILIGAGEVVPLVMGGQALLRQGVRGATAMAPSSAPIVRGTTQLVDQTASPTTGRLIAEQFASTTPLQEAGYTAASVAGGELGERTGLPGGEQIGMIAGPGIALLGGKTLGATLNSLENFLTSARNLNQVSDDIAGEILAERMLAEGFTPEDVMKALRDFGPEAVPADVLQGFREILRAAVNITGGRTERGAREVLGGRQKGSGERIGNAFDVINPGSTDEYIRMIDDQFAPQIKAAYDNAANSGIAIPEPLRILLTGDNALGRAFADAEGSVADLRAAGDTVSNFTYLDETKKILDDQIRVAYRAGENEKGRRLVRLRNKMVAEVDRQIPEYKEARNLYAGRAAIDDAVEAGKDYRKMTSMEVRELVEGYTQQEKTAYVLSVKDTILDAIDKTGANRDQVSALFGKNGDINKLKALFENVAQFNAFQKALERETNFLLTRRAALDNSSTTRQLKELEAQMSANKARDALKTGVNFISSNPAQTAREIESLSNDLKSEAGSKRFVEAMVRVGDILLTQGMDPVRLERLLKSGQATVLERELRAILNRPSFRGRTATTIGVTGSSVRGEE